MKARVLALLLVLVPRLGYGQDPGLSPVNSAPVELSPDEEVNVRVYRLANRSVVNITTRAPQPDDFFLAAAPRQGAGSGIVLNKSGHLLTNNHVVEEAQQVVVTFYDGSSAPAKLVGADPSNDLAVLKVDVPADKLYPIG